MVSRLDLRRRRRATAEPLGLAPEEGAQLRSAFTRLVHRLSDQQLRFAGPQLHRFAQERGTLMGIDSGEENEPTSPSHYPGLLRGLTGPDSAGPSPAPLDARLAALIDLLQLEAQDAPLLAIFARIALFDSWRALCDALPFRSHHVTPSIAAILGGLSAVDVERRLEPASRLLRTGLVEEAGEGEYEAGRLLKRVARLREVDPDRLLDLLIPFAPPSTLAWEDFCHLGALRDMALDLLRGADARGSAVSLLLHGAPGTGKSEFARALADRLGWQAVFAGQADENGNEPHRHERLAHVNILRSMTTPGARRLIVVDEADDLFQLGGHGPRNRSAMSKLWLNQIVEDPRTSILWITNDPRSLGETIVRRMTLAIQFDMPGRPVRERIVRRQALAVGLPLDDSDIDRLARLPAAPAVLANAVTASALTDRNVDGLVRAGESILTALGQPPMREGGCPACYDPSLSRADIDLNELAQRLAQTPERGWSLLLAGPSGTGKSAFARHLATRVGLDVEEVRGSDLLSPYVGETEAKIARAFRRAGDAGAMLLLDEADSFLFDRQVARRSWETGMVNEMLRWMEGLRTPFVATTNLADLLDPATQRRFTLRATFQPLCATAAAHLFRHYFGESSLANRTLPDGLTPGDFAVIARRAQILGEHRADHLVSWLQQERNARGAGTGRIGFHTDDPG